MSNNNHPGDIFSFTKDESHLEEITDKYPWCSVAQLSLLKQYNKNNSVKLETQIAKTALFFNDTGWLNWQLHLLSKEEKPGQVIEEKISVPEEEEILIGEETNEKIQQTLSQISSESHTEEKTIAFEPMHTTDYFASLGIKLTDEPVANDKLGNQVKSFTEWLKSMKKTHKENLPEGDEQTDKNIQQIAEHSNTNAEVVTEAMADVLVKQNKTDKAIEVYEKLSLINPSKSAYFAAKIDSLKTP